MNPPASIPFSLWLLPTADDAIALQAQIDALANRFNTPRFAPHVTIGLGTTRQSASGTSPDLDALQHDLTASGAALAPLELAAQAVTTGNSRFQCVLLALPTEPVAELARQLAGAVKARTGASFSATAHAHLSLVYADLEESARQALAASLTAPPRAIRFDRIAIATPGPGCPDFEDPTRWQIGAAVHLQAAG